MFIYILEMSKDTNCKCDSYGISERSFIRCNEFLMLYMFGNGVYMDISHTNFLVSLYAGVFLQLITGQMGTFGLCIFMSPRMFGGEGFMFMCFHSLSVRMVYVQLLMEFRIIV